jgi:hypothetical protein
MNRTVRSKRMRWAGHVSRIREGRNAYRKLVGTPERNSLLQKPRPSVDIIKMDLRDGMDWIDLDQGRDQLRALVNMIKNLWVP